LQRGKKKRQRTKGKQGSSLFYFLGHGRNERRGGGRRKKGKRNLFEFCNFGRRWGEKRTKIRSRVYLSILSNLSLTGCFKKKEEGEGKKGGRKSWSLKLCPKKRKEPETAPPYSPLQTGKREKKRKKEK